MEVIPCYIHIAWYNTHSSLPISSIHWYTHHCLIILITWSWFPQLHVASVAAAATSLMFVVLPMSSFFIRSLRMIFSNLRSIFLWQVYSLENPFLFGANMLTQAVSWNNSLQEKDFTAKPGAESGIPCSVSKTLPLSQAARVILLIK